MRQIVFPNAPASSPALLRWAGQGFGVSRGGTFRNDLTTLFSAPPMSLILRQTLFVSLKAQLPKDAAVDAYLQVTITGGTGPTFIHDKKTPALRHPGAAITAFARTTGAAEEMSQNAFDAVTNVVNQRIGTGAFYLKIRPLQEPFELPIAPDGYARWRFNVVAEKRA